MAKVTRENQKRKDKDSIKMRTAVEQERTKENNVQNTKKRRQVQRRKENS